MSQAAQARKQVIHEMKCLFHRWEEESDLDESDLLRCVDAAISDYFDEDVVDFEADFSLEDDDEE